MISVYLYIHYLLLLLLLFTLWLGIVCEYLSKKIENSIMKCDELLKKCDELIKDIEKENNKCQIGLKEQ